MPVNFFVYILKKASNGAIIQGSLNAPNKVKATHKIMNKYRNIPYELLNIRSCFPWKHDQRTDTVI